VHQGLEADFVNKFTRIHHANHFNVFRHPHPHVFQRHRGHRLAHSHAEYQGQVGTYSIPEGILLAGALPPNKHKLVVAWIEIHQDDLLADWALAVEGKKPFPIKGLDQ